MAVSVAQTFFNNLVDILGDYTINEIKTVIGDSTNNNRIPTIRQVIRFLNVIGEVTLAAQLEAAYATLKVDLAAAREVTNFRTDGFDINELLAVYESAVLGGTTTARRLLGKVLTAA